MYAQKDDNLFVNLFINGTANVDLNKTSIQITQQNNYPWNGDLLFKINPVKATTFNLLIRIPGWSQNKVMGSDLYRFQNNIATKAIIKINGLAVEYEVANGYASLKKAWKKGDIVSVNFDMPVQKIVANEKLKDDIGKVALQRGPIMYCAEWVDNGGKTSNIILPANTNFTTEYKSDLLNGVTVLKAQVPAVIISNNENLSTVKQAFTAIPYYSWANRGKGEMMIWFPTQIKDIELLAK